MTATSYEDRRRPVVYRGERVPGLLERRTADGSVVYELRRKVGGKAVRKTLAAKTVTDAIAEARRVAIQVEDERSVVSDPTMTLGDLRDGFERWASSRASTIAPSTRDLYLLRLDKHALRLLGRSTRAADVTPAHLRGMIDTLRNEKQSGSSVRGVVVATSALFRYGVRRGVIGSNPVRLLERGDRPSGKRTSEPRYLDADQIRALLYDLGDEFRPVAACCAYAGLRISEALALRWSDVDLDGAMLHVPGTKTATSDDDVPMVPELVAELRAHRGRVASESLARARGDAFVFMTLTGKPQHRKNALRAVHKAGDSAGLNPEGMERVGLHDLRHSCAGLLFASGASAPTVAAVLRHSDTRVTLTTYAGLVESDRAELRTPLADAFSTSRL